MRSSAPVSAFALRVENPTAHAANLSLLFSLPLGAQLHYDRPCAGDHLGLGSMTHLLRSTSAARNHTHCLRECDSDALCDSWVFDADGSSCRLCHGVPLGSWSGSWTSSGNPTATVANRISGVSGSWSTSPTALTFNTRKLPRYRCRLGLFSRWQRCRCWQGATDFRRVGMFR